MEWLWALIPLLEVWELDGLETDGVVAPSLEVIKPGVEERPVEDVEDFSGAVEVAEMGGGEFGGEDDTTGLGSEFGSVL